MRRGEGLSPRQRGRLVRDLAARTHVGPDGRPRRVGRSTLDRWVVAYRTGGFDALVPAARRVGLRTDADLLDVVVALKREQPDRTCAQVARVLARHLAAAGDPRRAPSPRTVARHLAREGIDRTGRVGAPRVFGRFEAAARNDRWTGDALHGPHVGGREAILFAVVDDHARLAVGYRWVHGEDELRLQAALRHALASRGVPRELYADNGAPYVGGQLHRSCAVLGIRLVHSRPGEPQGRGKVERFFRTVRDQFLVEAALADIPDLADLNRLFAAWVEQVYHRTVHSETKQTPLERFFADGPPELPAPDRLREAFLWRADRTVTTTATFQLERNRYETDPVLVGRKVEVVYDPFDLTAVEVRYNGQSFGTAVASVLGAHVHRRAQATLEADQPRPRSGIDYLDLVADAHRQATRRSINYADLPGHDNDRDDDGGGVPAAVGTPRILWPDGSVELPLPFGDGDGDGGASR